MKAVLTTGNGGYEKLVYQEVPTPVPGRDEILVRVLAAGVNNTEINTRIGWYSSSVKAATNQAAGEEELGEKADGGWNEATPFPFIQGTDCCGRVESVGPGVDESMIGSRGIVRACMRSEGFSSMENIWMGSDFDGAFADFVKIPAVEFFAVDCDWSDVELAAIPCAYGTSENMLHRAGLTEGERVLVAGASGGVGTATVQLAKRRGAYVIGIAGAAKADKVKALGADEVIPRGSDIVAALGEKSVDLVVDNVGGATFPEMLKVLKRGGRFVSSGAIAGPIVELDLRTMYLKDITLIGTTAWDEPVFPNLVRYIEGNEIRPTIAKTFPLAEIAAAQAEFVKKEFVGKFVLIP